uniref:DNA-directed DNA polymerase n=1 Tax=Anthurium amnicola TaxID=1678845 RepID=A0A1D1XWU1_9ARAE
MPIVGVTTRAAPLGPCSTPGPFLCFSPFPTFRFRVPGPASCRQLYSVPRRDDRKGIFFIPCRVAHCSDIAKLKSRRDSVLLQRPVFVKDVNYMTQYSAYYCTLSPYAKSDSCPNFVNVATYNFKWHPSEPVVVGITMQNDNKNYSRGTVCDDLFKSSKHKWQAEAEECKSSKADHQNYQNSMKNRVIMDDIQKNGALEAGNVVAGVHASQRKYPALVLTEQVTSSRQTVNKRRTVNKSVPHMQSLSQKPFCETKLNLSESKALRLEHLSDTEIEDIRYARDENPVGNITAKVHPREAHDIHGQVIGKDITKIYDKILIVDTISAAKRVVQLLTTTYKNLIHACDTEVAGIDVKQETPVDHGEIICFSIYSGSHADFGSGKSCIWVDVLDGERSILMEFTPFFENPAIKKVWHNYSFDSHSIENYGIKVSGFHADTMHLARLWDSSRRTEGGYSLEALTSNQDIICRQLPDIEDTLDIGKTSMKSLFGKKKIKKDGSEGKLVAVAPVETLQREERVPWICYSALDSVNTLKLFLSLKKKLMAKTWEVGHSIKGSMYDFYKQYWHPFGNLLVKMESEGMLVDRGYLAEIEKVAIAEQQVAADRFRMWVSEYCPDAKYMNVGSDAQIRQLFFGGVPNRKDPNQSLPVSKSFKVPNVDKIVEVGKKSPLKYRTITLEKICEMKGIDIYTTSGWPSVSGDALKALAGKVSTNNFYVPGDGFDFQFDNIATCLIAGSTVSDKAIDKSAYGLAFEAFGGGEKGTKACYNIAALCEMCSIDSLISNFILPLQGNHVAGCSGRIHCSLNINTETGRLSARRPNLQNQPALEKDRYKIRQAFIAAPGNSLIVADYGQLELRILAHLANCNSMLDAFKAGGDFHSRTAMNMYEHVREAVDQGRVLLEWHPHPGEEKPPAPLLKDAFAVERRKAKMLNFSIAYGKTPVGLSRDWKVSVVEAKQTVDLWYKERQEVLEWQEARKNEARYEQCVRTLLGRERHFPSMDKISSAQKGHIERAAINTPVQGSAADVAMCAMLEIDRNDRLKELKWKLLLQVHDEVILEGPTEYAEEAKGIVVDCMSRPFNGKNILKVDLVVDAKCAQNWYAAK